MMKQIFQSFRICDIFGQQIRLKAAGQSVFQTQIGAFMTLLLFSILIYSGSLFIIEMNKGKNAIINSQDAVIGTNEGFSFNSTELIFSAGLVDILGQPIPNEDNRIFKIGFYVCNKSLNETECVVIPGTICGERIRSAAKKLNIAEAYENITYCLSEEYIQENPEIRIQGSNRYDNFTLLGALIERCSNNTELFNCASNEEIDKYITNANLYYSYSFHQLNKELDVSPYQQTENVDLTSLYYQVGKYIKIYFQYSQSYLEYNPFYFFPRQVYHEGVEYQKTVTDSVLYFQDANTLARIELHLDAKKKVNFITYQTLMDVVAKIGGLFTIIRALIDILIFPIQSILYRLFLINFLINHQNKTNKKDVKIQNSKKKQINIQQLITSSDLRRFFYEKSQIINEYLDVRQILIHPLQFSEKIEGLQDSIRKIDILSSRQIKVISKQEMDELVMQSNHEECMDYKYLSSGTINSECKIGNQDQSIIPRMKIQIR
ncbi:unnamed protein product [Paramecium pentaurelia]|uniref:Transmembrane protein n=1 Tax=Paramecium pentaurelia TaxID=43138 RepID=A0A8S1SVK7_9CILI|nr:unnamed protein product [Paramecium pentaurelia]